VGSWIADESGFERDDRLPGQTDVAPRSCAQGPPPAGESTCSSEPNVGGRVPQHRVPREGLARWRAGGSSCAARFFQLQTIPADRWTGTGQHRNLNHQARRMEGFRSSTTSTRCARSGAAQMVPVAGRKGKDPIGRARSSNGLVRTRRDALKPDCSTGGQPGKVDRPGSNGARAVKAAKLWAGRTLDVLADSPRRRSKLVL